MAGIGINNTSKLGSHLLLVCGFYLIFILMLSFVQSEVNFLGRLSHPNLVKLLGFGRENSELFLVYEFMHRGSLDNHLFGSKKRCSQYV